MNKRLSVFGSTGSIGVNTLDLVKNTFDDIEIIGLTAGRNLKLLVEQALEFRPKIAVIADESQGAALAEALSGSDIRTGAGRAAMLDVAQEPTDIAMSAIVGFAGLEISLNLAQSTGTLALANKESLVCAGPMLRTACAKHSCNLLPVDSEHSAIFQAIGGETPDVIERVILTASGGPFRGKTRADLAGVTPQQAANHPKWDMGLRISIDSASLFNKAMEVIEAHELFDLPPEKIEVIVHPQSMVHSMVGFVDGAIMAHIGPPDMQGPIGYALSYPTRQKLPLERLDFAALGQLDFEPVDHDTFPAITLAHDAMVIGHCAGAVFNAAKEQALDLFLANNIPFLKMAELVHQALDNYGRYINDYGDDLSSIIKLDRDTRDFVISAA